MRMEAQSKYLQSILERAEAAFGCKATNLAELKSVRSEVDDLVSDVSNECLVSSFGKFPTVSYPSLSHINTSKRSHQEDESEGSNLRTDEMLIAMPMNVQSHLSWKDHSHC